MSEEISEKGRWIEKTNYEVKTRIEEIDKIIDEYKALSAGISSLIPSVEECASNLLNSYNLASEAITIEDEIFKKGLRSIGTYSSDIKDIATGLSGILGKISEEITKLEEEKSNLLPKLTYKVWEKYNDEIA